MELNKLPPVAKSFVMKCTKCEGEKFHTVLVHLSSDTAKVACDICKKKSTYKLGSEKKLKALSKGPSSSLAKKSTALSGKGDFIHKESYQKLIAESKGEASPYSIRSRFVLKEKIQHPKFGLGVVCRVLDDKVEVLFENDMKLLVHSFS